MASKSTLDYSKWDKLSKELDAESDEEEHHLCQNCCCHHTNDSYDEAAYEEDEEGDEEEGEEGEKEEGNQPSQFSYGSMFLPSKSTPKVCKRVTPNEHLEFHPKDALKVYFLLFPKTPTLSCQS
eukprot:Phypoly_transcript_08176.p2 GENE.Phypoly_transcript_08176~~Phypoly_transcript_08176.p2  ORF type:complete len:124 (+),score=31.80 Phypoly_transcript_08176:16-387(+)